MEERREGEKKGKEGRTKIEGRKVGRERRRKEGE